jgi:hypothetical protein
MPQLPLGKRGLWGVLSVELALRALHDGEFYTTTPTKQV